MSKDLMLIFLIAFALFAMQGAGGYFQIMNYRKAVRRVHQFGNVGIGQKKGKFLSGNLVLVASDSQGIIRRIEVMEGLTFLTKFKERNEILDKSPIGESIYTYLEEFKSMEVKRQKFYKGYIQAMEALELRFQGENEEVHG